MTNETQTIPPDDLQRNLALARPNEDEKLPHIGLAGDTYTILLTGADTAGRYCLIDMLVPPGGGPPPHRHNIEEMFTILDGRDRGHFPWREIRSAGRPDSQHSGQRASPFSERLGAAGAAVVRVFASRAGRVFYGRWRSRRESHRSAPKTRRGQPSGAQSES